MSSSLPSQEAVRSAPAVRSQLAAFFSGVVTESPAPLQTETGPTYETALPSAFLLPPDSPSAPGAGPLSPEPLIGVKTIPITPIAPANLSMLTPAARNPDRLLSDDKPDLPGPVLRRKRSERLHLQSFIRRQHDGDNDETNS
jgi:hypothetical protein